MSLASNPKTGRLVMPLAVGIVVLTVIAIVIYLYGRTSRKSREKELALKLEKSGEWCGALANWEQYLAKCSQGSDDRNDAEQHCAVAKWRCENDDGWRKAFELQSREQWCEARKTWESLLSTMPAGDLAGKRKEAEGNRDQTRDKCDGPVKPGKQVDSSPGKSKDKPEKVSLAEISRRYPVGRVVRSLGIIKLQGKGINRNWGLKGEANFLYLYRIVAETRVIEVNVDQERIVFEQWFPEVSQNRVVSNKSVELNLQVSPIGQLIWDEIEKTILKSLPGYVPIRKLFDIAAVTDPRAKRLLTWLHDLLEQQGILLDAGGQVEIGQQIERLAGLKVKLEYANGMGVTRITPLEGNLLNETELVRLAYASSLLMDYYVLPNVGVEEGQEWTVNPRDVSGMLAFGGDVRLGGSLKLRRGKDQGKTAILQVKGGTLDIENQSDVAEDSARIKVLDGGLIEFDLNGYFVRKAQIKMQANTLWRSKDHLLFETEKIRDLSMESLYRALPEGVTK